MKNCMNNSATNWPAMSVPTITGMRHSRIRQGWKFSLGTSKACLGYKPEVNLDKLMVSR
jgi:hypothetical protein